MSRAFHGKIGLEGDRRGSEANRAGLDKLMRQFINRSSAFTGPVLDCDVCNAVLVFSVEGQLTFKFEHGEYLLSLFD